MSSRLNKLRSLFLSPNSKLELFLRTWYHKVAATRFFFHVQHWLARRSYKKYLAYQKNKPLQDINQIKFKPKVTFILPCPENNLDGIVDTLKSIINLEGENWEVLLVPGHGGFDIHQLPESCQDARIHLLRTKSNNFAHAISGEFLVFSAPGDKFFNSFLVRIYEFLEIDASPDLIYYDCEYLEKTTHNYHAFFKPKALSPALLLSVNYLSRGLYRYTAVIEKLSSIDSIMDFQSEEYALVLWLCEINAKIKHLPSILVSQTSLPKPNNSATKQVVTAYLKRQDLERVSLEDTPQGTRFTWRTGHPSIAIVIPTKNNQELLQPLLRSILHQNAQNLTITIVDNDSQNSATLAFYKMISGEPNISIIPYPKQFNYSQAINLGVSESNSDLVLVLNDDMKATDTHWLDELSQWAIRPEVGVVGAKLLRANYTIQHAGIILGLSGFMGHIYLNAPEHYTGLFGSVDWMRNYLAVTGACQMFRREVFEEVGGYDEGYQLAFGDIDFCARVYERGYQIIYTPFANLFHYEGLSRGYNTPVSDALKGYDQMENYLVDDDPFFSPNLTYTRIPKCTIRPNTMGERSMHIKERKKFYTRE